MDAKIEWNEKGRSKEYGRLIVPITEDIEIRRLWNGHGAYPAVAIWDEKDGTHTMHILVKRDLKPKKKQKDHEISSTEYAYSRCSNPAEIMNE
jgi:hypothetical protein